ncbi:MAG: coenzyme F420-0:L-glutamate ligase [Oscillospiraceae bacterium]
MSKTIGTVSRGIRAPIIRQGDDLVSIVSDCVLAASQEEGFALCDRDVVGITEAVVARSQGNYATVDDIAADVRTHFSDAEPLGVLFPILSRNRFAICLRGIARGVKKIVLMLSYPSDEVGNHLIDPDLLDSEGVNPWSDVLTLPRYRALFGHPVHPFTGIDYVDYYCSLIEEEGAEVEVVFANRPEVILSFTKQVLCCDIHTRRHTERLLQNAGAAHVLTLDGLMNHSINGSGFNADYGLLGSNKATETSIKLFPRDCEAFAMAVQNTLLERTGRRLEVLVYGDGAFKDPVGKIWELADPVVSPGHTKGLVGTPNELKLKYLADNDFAGLAGDALRNAIAARIRQKDTNLKGSMASQGTTPRRLTDLIGSLCDLTSGSGDKGTPIILIQGYFTNYAD